MFFPERINVAKRGATVYKCIYCLKQVTHYGGFKSAMEEVTQLDSELFHNHQLQCHLSDLLLKNFEYNVQEYLFLLTRSPISSTYLLPYSLGCSSRGESLLDALAQDLL